MAIQQINLGTYSNDGTGDDLRTAFEKVRANFIELYSTVFGANVGASPPISGVEEGELWWSTVEGKLYIYYGTAWIESTPVPEPVLYDISATAAINGANIHLNGSNNDSDDVKIVSGTNITVTRTDANSITVDANIISINDLLDVNTVLTLPTIGQALIWNGTNWVPGSVAAGGNNFEFGGFTKIFTDPVSYLLDITGMNMGTFLLPAVQSVDLGTF
jgi:hypothetical protein